MPAAKSEENVGESSLEKRYLHQVSGVSVCGYTGFLTETSLSES